MIYLHQSGAPSQMDLFDPKPKLAEHFGEDLPDSIRRGQRLTGMTSNAEDVSRWRPRVYKFAQHGKAGTGSANCCRTPRRVADDICVVKSLFTEAINHDPGHHVHPDRQPGGRTAVLRLVGHLRAWQRERRSAGVRRDDLARHGPPVDQPLYDRLWGSGFLPTAYQGVKFRSEGDPVLYLSNPPGRRRRPCAARCSTTSAQLNESQPAESSAIRRSSRASASTRWRTGCRRRCRS